jgi:hypothetical protein
MATRKKKTEAPAVVEPTGRCRDCRWADFSNKEVIRCRRYPPVPVFDGSEGYVDSYTPVISADDYCGEFAAHLSS